MEQLALLFSLFIVYAFLGWIMEVLAVFKGTKKLVNRGFLIGPVCPIYGWGAILMTLCLDAFKESPIILFIMAIFICSLLEYFTSYFMEKFFSARWWDYSNRFLNINGRVCLSNALAFGILGLLMIYVLNPFTTKIILSIPRFILYIIDIFLLILYIIDNIISFKVIANFKNLSKSIHKDSTEEITKNVRAKLIARGGLYKRLALAFDFEASEKLIKEKLRNTKDKIKKINKKRKEEIKKEKEKLNEKINDINKKYHKKEKKLKNKNK